MHLYKPIFRFVFDLKLNETCDKENYFLCPLGFQCKREGFFQKIKDEDGEGCNIEGSLEVNKVAGNFYFVPGKSLYQSNIHGLLALQKDSYNVR